MIAVTRRLGRRLRGTADELLPVESILGGALRLRGGGLRAVLECPTLAFGIKGETEQRAVVEGWASLVNSLAHPLQIVIRARSVNSTALAALQGASSPAQESLGDAYRRLIDSLAGRREIVDRRYYVVVPWDAPPARGRSTMIDGLEALEQRARWVAECLRRLDLEPRRLADHELADVLRLGLDLTVSRQPVAVDDTLADVSTLIAPAGVAEHAGSLEVGERHARALLVVRYPALLEPGWLGALTSFDGDLDLALYIAPSAGVAAMAFVERRVAELSSTVRVSEERGTRTDPYRRQALTDALALRDQLAQGSERLFDTTLAMTVWADGLDELESRTQSLEALLGARLVHTRRLRFEMRAGLLASMPLGRAAPGSSRVLSTAALAATFPFSGSDLRGRSGLLYGVNTATRSAVVLDRFALENHNAVVFATSGAGKSYLVKVELARAYLSGTRCLVIDPESEYVSLLGALGAAIVPVRPGMTSGLDPFAVADGAPGTLAVRIATLGTLIDLLASGLEPRERAIVDQVLCVAYANAGYRDGEPVTGLVPPRLAMIQAHLRAAGGFEHIVARLERYASGADAWLFAAGETSVLAKAQSVVYALAGLPEEARAAAMFIVLDRIWTSLAASDRQTFVVVDEAWWLMRRPDTAAFLFRLVKTARKRRAGLTLITQDVGDVLGHPDGEAVISNSALQILMKQAPQALPRLAQLFRLTGAEQSFLLGAQRGEALLVAQGRRVPLRMLASDEEARLIEGHARPS